MHRKESVPAGGLRGTFGTSVKFLGLIPGLSPRDNYARVDY